MRRLQASCCLLPPRGVSEAVSEARSCWNHQGSRIPRIESELCLVDGIEGGRSAGCASYIQTREADETEAGDDDEKLSQAYASQENLGGLRYQMKLHLTQQHTSDNLTILEQSRTTSSSETVKRHEIHAKISYVADGIEASK